MKIERRDAHVHVHLDEVDVQNFNRTEQTAIPVDPEYGKIIFSFSRLSGDLLRVIPNAIRKNNLAWERLKEYAHKYIDKI